MNTSKMVSRKKYFRGELPCSWCDSGKHTSCRPRLDGTLCTCNCEKSEMIRSVVEEKTAKALAAGIPTPRLEEMIEIICPNLKLGY